MRRVSIPGIFQVTWQAAGAFRQLQLKWPFTAHAAPGLLV